MDRIEAETLAALESEDCRIVVVAMGCSGRVLEKRLIAGGVNAFPFDLGSLLDALAGWNTRAWIEIRPTSEGAWRTSPASSPRQKSRSG